MRYQIITYNEDTGADECREHSRKADAIRDAKARCYSSASGRGTDRGAIVYDLKARRRPVHAAYKRAALLRFVVNHKNGIVHNILRAKRCGAAALVSPYAGFILRLYH